jgi:DNA-binding phage protein
MSEKNIIIFPLEVANFLDSESAINNYIDSILEENPMLIESALQDVAKAREILSMADYPLAA